MYVCMSFISQQQQHKPKHNDTIKADKKEAVKNDIRYDMQIIHRTDITNVHHHATRHSHRIFKNWNGLIVVEDQNALSTTNRKPPKIYSTNFQIRQRTIDEERFFKQLTY